MESYFYTIADRLQQLLSGEEVYTAWFEGEISNFVRFNRALVRQPGSVAHQYLNVDLIRDRHHANKTITLSGDLNVDGERLKRAIESLREKLSHVEPDPYLLYNTEVASTSHTSTETIPESTAIVQEILAAVEKFDFVGFYADGKVARGFANSLGQRNWWEKNSFNLDWSLYSEGDKAVKANYAGFEWNSELFREKLNKCTEQLQIIQQPSRTIEPGKYRVYLAPTAMKEVLGMVCWGGFGLKSSRTKQTPLIKMREEQMRLHPAISIQENTGAGAGPNFQSQGFAKPDRVTLISEGQLSDPLVSPRSATEYGVETNGANDSEAPQALDMAAGELAASDIEKQLDTGVYINNLWYLNYSDRPAARMTGMTRFATFWVKNGQLVAPVNVMRFDESLYRMWGDFLVDLTRDREMLLSANTWDGRSTSSVRLPGAIVDEFTFTL